ncbi:hypothetical protein [Thioclava sp. GXIMD4216]|uniref:Uncharacterized protein n=1 Tax=Thioclava litoralis TaxID=3076557 RepID=A0ABZ1E1A1_9RHOB|nr:hypothetical protein RPE78_00830 [Thioclava sp. FTW29]
MQVVFHLGAHATDEDSLVRCLARNPRVLDENGVIVPHPRRYRMVLRDTLLALKGGEADPETADAVLAAVTDKEEINRIIFSHEYFMCIPERVVTDKGFYTMVPGKLEPLANIFPDAEIEFHLALINPATLIPALATRLPERSYDDLMQGVDPRDLRWRPVLERMVEAAQGHKIVVWCNEDAPLIWPEILHSLSGISGDVTLNGEQMILKTIMTEGGFRRYADYILNNPPKTVEQRRKITMAFLDKFAKPDELEMDVALPGWDEALIDEVTALYEADIDAIAAMPNVTFLAP